MPHAVRENPVPNSPHEEPTRQFYFGDAGISQFPLTRRAVPASWLEEWKRSGIVEWWGWQKEIAAGDFSGSASMKLL
jgi:hypothetical protein